MTQSNFPKALERFDSFVHRHNGPSETEIQEMLRFLGLSSTEDLSRAAIPARIRSGRPLNIGTARSEYDALKEIESFASQNEIFRSFIGMGYSGCITPAVIQRNILESPGWYTQYTPYQAEISQGRLEALLNFQTMISDLTGLEVANASLLDEATAAAEAMAFCFAAKGRDSGRAFFVSEDCHPQTLAVIQTRAEPLGIEIVLGNPEKFDFKKSAFGVLVQYPTTDGIIYDYREFFEKAHVAGAMTVAAADLLSLALLTPPGEWGADVAVGSSQRFGVPLGYGGPHAAYFATREQYKRLIPGRIVGLSKDKNGRNAVRLALQTREQHIRRDKATSNICTAQVLLAVTASMYAIYHGPTGIRKIAERVHLLTAILQAGLKRLGFDSGSKPFFDTLRVSLGSISEGAIFSEAKIRRINLRKREDKSVGVALDETTSEHDLEDLFAIFAGASGQRADFTVVDLVKTLNVGFVAPFSRKSAYLTHSVFNRYHSETEMLRYMKKLESRDLSLTTSMIPLGSCTMKLNAAVEMLPITWPEFGNIHPFVPREQAQGYHAMFKDLETKLAEITGFDGVSLQPNAGSQGEYAGLLIIRKYHQRRGEAQRSTCLIPRSAHGTNPATASMAGMKVVVVECDSKGNVDVADLRAKAQEHAKDLAALMVTYPSTHGVFEEGIMEICSIVHQYGGQVYMDGANMNAQIGLCRPGEYGPDVCHLNLHKTFCIPHGGGGPGMGPIGVKAHLVPFLPNHPMAPVGGEQGISAISAAPWGSPSILPISWMYLAMMGSQGLRQATEVAVLNANYIAKRLDPYFPILYKGEKGWIAHECIFDLRQFKVLGIEVEDVAKRLMDYGFHSPTISFPVAGTVTIEPTESESKRELDRFCEAMISIRQEIAEIESGRMDRLNNPLKNAPHTAEEVTRSEWEHSYTREKAAFPAPWLKEHKYWPPVARIDAVLGDRNLICSCPSVDAYG